MKNPSPLVFRRHSAVAKNHVVLGVDPSLASTGYAYRGANGRVITDRITTGKLRDAHRLFYTRLQLGKILDIAKPTMVVYEGYSLGRTGYGTFAIAELGGVLKTLIWERGIDLMEVPPMSMKSVIALNGSAEKKDITTALKVRFNLDISQPDEADAAALMLIGEMRCGIRRVDQKVGKSDRFDAIRQCQIAKGKLTLISNSQ